MGRARILKQPLLIAALAAAPMALGGCAMTSTYGTGEAPEMALFREMTGGLMSRDEKKPIDYQPRAPLVMPASAEQLPPPEETASVADPDWPIDPNERTIAEDARNQDDDPYNDVTPEDYRRLRPLKGLFGSRTQAPRRPNDDLAADRQDFYAFIHSKQKQRDDFNKALADSKGLGHPQERRYLTDPPLTYREPADTAPQEFKDIGKNRPFWKKLFPGAG
jgi:hypothetical protein